MNQEPHTRNIVVLGMHRSGTSAVAGALAAMGISAGDESALMPAQGDNPLGFWERLDVVDLNEAMLASAGGSWFDIPSSFEPDAGQVEAARGVCQAMGPSPWLLKDPRMVLTWPAWEPSLERPLIVFVYRSPEAVALSLQKRNGFPLEYGLALWEYYNRRAMEIAQSHDCVAIAYESLLEDPAAALDKLSRKLSESGVQLRPHSDTLEGIFDRRLSHSEVGSGDVSHFLNAAQRDLHQQCLQAISGAGFEQTPAIDSRLLLHRIHDFAAASAASARALELEADKNRIEGEYLSLKRVFSSLEKERQVLIEDRLNYLEELERDRERLLETHRGLLQEHEELAVAFRRNDKEILALRADRDHLLALYDETRVKYDETSQKAEHLYGQLGLISRRLLEFEASLLGRLFRWISGVYKLLRRRRGTSTSLDLAIQSARGFYPEGVELPARPVGKVGLFFQIVRYMVKNPSGSRRSFSMERLRRGLSVFVGSDKSQLQTWVGQRFPDHPLEEKPGVKPDLVEELDELELHFPVVEDPQVSIVIPVYNAYRMTAFCLRSLLETDAGASYEVIIADDASSDLTQTLGERISGVQWARAAENQGFVKNCNAGAMHASGQYLLLLNNDTAFTAGWLGELVSVLETRPDAGVVGPRLLFGNGEQQEAGGIIWDDASGWNYGRLDDPDNPAFNYLRSTDYVSGACLLVRHALWRELGGFDEHFAPAYYEDTDLCFAARKAGYEVLYQPAASVYHFEGISHGTDLNAGIKKNQLVNQKKFLKKWSDVLSQDHFSNGEEVFLARDRSRGKRTVLVIDHYVPSFDKDAGSRSTWLYLRLLVELGYNVKFLGANFFPHQPYLKDLQQRGIEVLVGESIARNLEQWFSDNIRYIDAIYLHRPHVAEQFLPILDTLDPRPPIIYFGHDLHYLRLEREYQLTGDEQSRRDSESWRKREFKVFEGVDHIYYPSSAEIEEIHRHFPDKSAHAIPLYVLDKPDSPPYEAQTRNGMIFVAGFNHPPNLDGLKWFIAEVLPLVRNHYPDLPLHIVGSNMPDEVKAFQDEGITVHGFLSDDALAELYCKVKLVVVPLRYGAGVKGKVVDSLRHGLPCVTTSIGAEGLPQADQVLHVADGAPEFAQAIVSIESGDSDALKKLDQYDVYLEDHFGKEKAAAILRQHFGDPVKAP